MKCSNIECVKHWICLLHVGRLSHTGADCWNARLFIAYHSSKGLEYKTVFILDANETVMPHKKAVITADIEEERRMFYVAMTRAKDNLHIYYVKERFNKEMEPSRFVQELMMESEIVKEIETNKKSR